MADVTAIAIWIPFLAITLGIGTIVTLIITLHRAKLRELDQRHKERMAAIEKGLDPYPGQADPPLPELPVRAAGSDRLPSRFLLRGLMWLGVGLAVALSSGVNGVRWSAFLGWIAAAIGGAQVVYYVVEGRRAAPLPPASSREQPPGTDQGA